MKCDRTHVAVRLVGRPESHCARSGRAAEGARTPRSGRRRVTSSARRPQLLLSCARRLVRPTSRRARRRPDLDPTGATFRPPSDVGRGERPKTRRAMLRVKGAPREIARGEAIAAADKTLHSYVTRARHCYGCYVRPPVRVSRRLRLPATSTGNNNDAFRRSQRGAARALRHAGVCLFSLSLCFFFLFVFPRTTALGVLSIQRRS